MLFVGHLVIPQVYQNARGIRVDNSGPIVTATISPVLPAPYVVDTLNPSTVAVTYISGPPISSVTFQKVLNTSTTLIGGALAIAAELALGWRLCACRMFRHA